MFVHLQVVGMPKSCFGFLYCLFPIGVEKWFHGTSSYANYEEFSWKLCLHHGLLDILFLESRIIILGGGNSNIFYFHPENCGFMIQFDLRIFFK